MNNRELTLHIKHLARQIGFDSCGIAKAESLDDEARFLEAWLNQNLHGKMAYLENHFEKRVDPRKLVEGAKSVISLSYNYFNNTKFSSPGKRTSSSPPVKKLKKGNYLKVKGIERTVRNVATLVGLIDYFFLIILYKLIHDKVSI